MPTPVKENGANGDIIQVFVPNRRLNGDTHALTFGDIVRFTEAGRYEFDDDGIKVPFSAGMTMGLPHAVASMKIYDLATGNTLTAQTIEVM